MLEEKTASKIIKRSPLLSCLWTLMFARLKENPWNTTKITVILGVYINAVPSVTIMYNIKTITKITCLHKQIIRERAVYNFTKCVKKTLKLQNSESERRHRLFTETYTLSHL